MTKRKASQVFLIDRHFQVTNDTVIASAAKQS